MAKLKRSLKSCPFCGERPAVAYHRPPPLKIPRFFLFCKGCGAYTEDHSTSEQARKAWNRREKGDTNA